ncbi:MAG: iron-sulfur cluster assembly accessory protein [Verrucomicrobiaceae bacterium]|nr:iron-sulfur cluster assembly accessory protein [Verrucomicrobiaceae bacterium]
MIEVTASAARHLLDLLEEKDISPAEKGLRLFVEKGGCAGMSYAMKIDAPAEGDAIFTRDEARVFVDAESLVYLDGCHLDYVEALNDSGFKIGNPNAARSCGCGTSFEPARPGNAADEATVPDEGEMCGSGKN